MPSQETAPDLPGMYTLPDLGTAPSDVASGDFNRDGIDDLAVSYAYSNKIAWFHGSGNGALNLGGAQSLGEYPHPSSSHPRRMLPADIDRDGLLDLLVVCSGDRNTRVDPSVGVLYGLPAGFEPWQPVRAWSENHMPRPEFSGTLAWGYVDGDELPDLVVGHRLSHQISLVRHAGGRQWQAPVLFAVSYMDSGDELTDVELNDLDLDGTTDLIISSTRQIQVWRGDDRSSFSLRKKLAEGLNFEAIATADLDRNGQWDLLAVDTGAGTLRLFMNPTPEALVTSEETIQLKEGAQPIDLTIEDANRDGAPDVVVAFRGSAGGQRLLNQFALRRAAPMGPPVAPPPGLMPEENFVTGKEPRAVAVGDFDHDGWSDVALANEGDRNGDTTNSDVTVHFNLRKGETPRNAIRIQGNSGAPPGLKPDLDQPRGLAWDPTRQGLWTCDRLRRQVVLLNPDLTVIRSISFDQLGLDDLEDPQDLACDAQGDLWLSDRLAARVWRVDPEVNGSAHAYPTSTAGIERPAGIAYDHQGGRLLIADQQRPGLAISTTPGEIASFSATVGPYRDLAWAQTTHTLCGIPEVAPDKPELACDADLKGPTAPINLAALAPMLAHGRVQSVAENGNGGWWLLFESGELIQLPRDGQVTVSPTDLSPMRDVRAIDMAHNGGLLMAEGGLGGLLARIDLLPDPDPPHTVRLNRRQTSEPVRIEGVDLSREAGLWVLDGNQRMLFRYPPDFGTPKPYLRNRLGNMRVRGFAYDFETDRAYVGAPGRVIEAKVNPPDSAPTSETAAQQLVIHMLPAEVMPDSLILRPDEQALYVFDARHGWMYRLDLAGDAAPHFFAQTFTLPAGFRPVAMTWSQSPGAAALAGDTPGHWILAANGNVSPRNAEVSTQTAACPTWSFYP